MLKKNIKVDLIYVGGIEDRRRKVLEIRPNGDVKYVTIKANGRDGVTTACSLKSFADWAEKKDPLLGKAYSKQKLAAIHKKRLATYDKMNAGEKKDVSQAPRTIVPNASSHERPW